MDATQDGLWDLNVVTGEAYFSPGYTAMLGYSVETVVPGFQFWLDHVHQGDKEAALVPITDCIENRQEFFEVKFRMKTKDNQWLWILGRGKAVARDEQGRAIRMIGTHTDISKRKLAEANLLATNEKLETLTRKANDLATRAEAASQAPTVNREPLNREPNDREPRIPIIAMTAGAMQQDRERCFEAGMDDHVAKPVKPKELARALGKWLPIPEG